MKRNMYPMIEWNRVSFILPERDSEVYAFDKMMAHVDRFFINFDPILLDPDYTCWIYTEDLHRVLLEN